MSLRDTIKQANDRRDETVDVPEWGVTLSVRSMDGLTRVRMLRQLEALDGNTNIEKVYPSIIVATCYDPDSGEKVFTDEDVDWLNGKNAGVIERVAEAGLRVSGLAEGAADEAARQFPGVAAVEGGRPAEDVG